MSPVAVFDPVFDDWETVMGNQPPTVVTVTVVHGDSLDDAEKAKARPTVIVAHTIKGKGVSFIENKVEWHYKTPNKEELEIALNELK